MLALAKGKQGWNINDEHVQQRDEQPTTETIDAGTFEAPNEAHRPRDRAGNGRGQDELERDDRRDAKDMAERHSDRRDPDDQRRIDIDQLTAIKLRARQPAARHV